MVTLVTEGDWYVSNDKTLFGRQNGQYKKLNSVFTTPSP